MCVCVNVGVRKGKPLYFPDNVTVTVEVWQLLCTKFFENFSGKIFNCLA